MTIDGSGYTITVSGDSLNDGDRDVRVFLVKPDKTVNLSYLNIVSGVNVLGGGVQNNGTLTVSHSTIADNVGVAGFSSVGSGVFNGGNMTLNNSTIANNNTMNGSSSSGGGIYNTVTLTVNNSTFSNNTANEDGGGIYNSGTLTVNNSTFSGNSANVDGGAIYNKIDNTLHLKNTILANSSSGQDCVNDGILGTDTNNLIESHTSCGTPVSTADPLLLSLADNGGNTQTFALSLGSPAIDAGDSTTCSGSEINSQDQRGEPRPTACDIGPTNWKLAR